MSKPSSSSSHGTWHWEEADPLTQVVLGVFDTALADKNSRWRRKTQDQSVITAAAVVLDSSTEVAEELYGRRVLWGAIVAGRFATDLALSAKHLAHFAGPDTGGLLDALANRITESLPRAELRPQINSDFQCLAGLALGAMISFADVSPQPHVLET